MKLRFSVLLGLLLGLGCPQVLATSSAQRYLAIQTSACAGVLVGGYCWYSGALNGTCDTACATHGGCNLNGVLNYAGTSGTLANCQSVLVALGLGTGSAIDYGAGTSGGCLYTTSPGRIRQVGGATTCSGAYLNGTRACSCNK